MCVFAFDGITEGALWQNCIKVKVSCGFSCTQISLTALGDSSMLTHQAGEHGPSA